MDIEELIQRTLFRSPFNLLFAMLLLATFSYSCVNDLQVPTTTTSVVTSVVTTSYPVTTTMAYYTTLTDTITGVPLTFTSFITQVSWVTTVSTTSYFITTTQTVRLILEKLVGASHA